MRYFCPYCSPHYQIHEERSDGVMVCGYCGDPLVKEPTIKLTQIFSFIAAIAFISPLLITAFSFIQDWKRPQPQRSIQVVKALIGTEL
ncbi:hypothetical protein [Prochlorococcus sp. MIT 1300]|uniref:hypothetical protein n=1 Tax=Prochlorococcus sp. MIT 1300 TaxID=3096218 RepID=UPI002A75F564|nr:hypothetical protein [Prochlorococcus sp. MIT 1300]